MVVVVVVCCVTVVGMFLSAGSEWGWERALLELVPLGLVLLFMWVLPWLVGLVKEGWSDVRSWREGRDGGSVGDGSGGVSEG